MLQVAPRGQRQALVHGGHALAAAARRQARAEVAEGRSQQRQPQAGALRRELGAQTAVGVDLVPGLGIAGHLEMRRQHAQRRVELGTRRDWHLPALRHQLVHAQLRRGQPHQLGAAFAIGQQHQAALPRTLRAPTRGQQLVLGLGLAMLVGAHRVEQAKSDVLALGHDLQRRQAFADLDETRGLALPGDKGVAHQRRRGIDDVQHWAVAIVLAPQRTQQRGIVRGQVLALDQRGQRHRLRLAQAAHAGLLLQRLDRSNAAVGPRRNHPDQPILHGGGGIARRVGCSTTQRQDRGQRLAPAVLCRPDEERRPGIGRCRRLTQQRGRSAARQARRPGHAGRVVLFSQRQRVGTQIGRLGHLDAQPGRQQQVVQILQRLHARMVVPHQPEMRHAPSAHRPAAGRWRRPTRPRNRRGRRHHACRLRRRRTCAPCSRRPARAAPAAPSRRSSRWTARPGSCAARPPRRSSSRPPRNGWRPGPSGLRPWRTPPPSARHRRCRNRHKAPGRPPGRRGTAASRPGATAWTATPRSVPCARCASSQSSSGRTWVSAKPLSTTIIRSAKSACRAGSRRSNKPASKGCSTARRNAPLHRCVKV